MNWLFEIFLGLCIFPIFLIGFIGIHIINDLWTRLGTERFLIGLYIISLVLIDKLSCRMTPVKNNILRYWDWFHEHITFSKVIMCIGLFLSLVFYIETFKI